MTDRATPQRPHVPPPVPRRRQRFNAQQMRVLNFIQPEQGFRPLVPPRQDRAPSNFKQTYAPDQLKVLRKAVDRGGLKGVGKFGRLLDAADKISGGKPAALTKQLKQVQAMIDTAQDYLDKRLEDDDELPDQFDDRKQMLKMTTAKAMLDEAKHLKQNLIDRQFANTTADDPEEREAASAGRAKAMLDTFGARQPDGGTSTVFLLNNSDGRVGYAFKTIDGESSQSGMPNGSGAVREALTSLVSNTIRQQTGLDFGFPQATLATIDGTQGALIEGLKGKVLDAEELVKKAGDEGWSPEKFFEEKAKLVGPANAVPPRELQKVLLCNLATAQFDIKWENLMLSGDGGNAVAQPFDAGAAFPTDDLIRTTVERGGVPGATLLQNPGDGSELAAANQPMDPALVGPFLAIDVPALRKAMADERARLCRQHQLDPRLLDDVAAERGLQSIATVQQILTRRPDMTMKEFVEAFGRRLGELV